MSLRFISPEVHGIIDYATAVALPMVPRMMGFDKTVTHVHDAVAGSVGLMAAATQQMPGVVHAVPLKAHLAIDGMTGAGLLAAAAFMDEEDATARFCTGVVGAFLLMQALFTRTSATDDDQAAPVQKYVKRRARELVNA